MLSRNLSGSSGSTSTAISCCEPGIQEAREALPARVIRMWWLHLGQTWRLRSSSARYSTASQAGHLIQRPSGTERVRRSVLMREGMIFSNQVTAVLLAAWPEVYRKLAGTDGSP